MSNEEEDDLEDIFGEIGDDEFEDIDTGIKEVPGDNFSIRSIHLDPSTTRLQLAMRLMSLANPVGGLDVNTIAIVQTLDDMTGGACSARVTLKRLEVKFYWSWHFRATVDVMLQSEFPRESRLEINAYNNLQFLAAYAAFQAMQAEEAYISACDAAGIEPQSDNIKDGVLKTSDPFEYEHSVFTNTVFDPTSSSSA